MFKKKPNIKSLAPLRSSDRRKIADQIIADYQLEVLPDSATDSIVPNEGQTNGGNTLFAVRSWVLPENTQSGRFSTTAGPDLKPVNGAVYVGSYGEEEPRILWFKTEERLYPTVYTLWHVPQIVPLLHTHLGVMQKLRGGADLMIPGLVRGPPFPSSAKRGSIVAIAAEECPSVPLVVGVCELDVSKLGNVRGEKGRAVRGVHWAGDQLWEWSMEGSQGGDIPASIEGWLPGDASTNELDENVRGLSLMDEDEDGGIKLGGEAEGDSAKGEIGIVERDSNSNATQKLGEETSFSTNDVDKVFRDAFLYGLYHHKATKPDEGPQYGLKFPLTSSSVISDLVLPFLPIFTQSEATALQLKKTSWKSAKKFIKYLDKEKLVKSKERNGGETVILDIDFNDRALSNFVPYKLPKKIAASNEEGDTNRQLGGQSGDSSVGQQLKRVILYKPKEKYSPIFEASNASPKSMYLTSEIRPIVTAYIEAESLVSSANKRLVKLNPVLANSVFDSQSSLDRDILAKGEVPRDVLIERVTKGCSPFWVVLRGNQTKNDVKPRAGSPPDIQIVMETRSGNKVVTKASGLEIYHINPQPLADELQKACASSTSVSQLVGSSPKTPLLEVMVQGPQSQTVIKALEKRGVNRQWIDVNDKTKKKKKG